MKAREWFLTRLRNRPAILKRINGPTIRFFLVFSLATLVVMIIVPEKDEAKALWIGVTLMVLTLVLGLFLRLRSPWSRRVVGAIDLFLFNLALVVVLVEVGLTVVASVSDNPLFLIYSREREETLLSRRKAEVNRTRMGFTSNALGFYDEPFRKEKTEGVTRILALGDSFCYGIVPYGLNFLTILDESLGDEVEVYNFGITATEPTDYLWLLYSEGVEYAPDIVLVHIFVGNDIAHQRPVRFLDPRRWYGWTIPVRLYKIACEAHRLGVDPSDLGRIETSYSGEGDPAQEPYHRDVSLESKRFSDVVFYDEVERRSLFTCHRQRREEYDEAFRVILDIRRTAGVRTIVVLIPDCFQVDDAVWEEVFRRNPNFGQHKFSRTKSNEEFSRFARREGIEVIDLLPALLEGHRKYGRVYHLNDSHWNAYGNKVAAEEIERYLEEHRNE